MKQAHRLDALTRADCQLVRQWRNAAHDVGMLRTPYPLNPDQQDAFYDRAILQPANSAHRYYAVRPLNTLPDDCLCAMVGLTNISWENGHTEISLIVDPMYRRQGVGKDAVRLVLIEALTRLRLNAVYGEVYHCNETGLLFWRQIINLFGAKVSRLPARKFWQGRFHDSTYFTITASAFRRSGCG